MAVVKYVKVERSTQLSRSTTIPVKNKKVVVTAGKIYDGNSKWEANNRKRKWGANNNSCKLVWWKKDHFLPHKILIELYQGL